MRTPLRSALSAAAFAAALALTACSSSAVVDDGADVEVEVPAPSAPAVPAAPVDGIAECPAGFMDELNALGADSGAHFIEVDANALVEESNISFPGTGCFFQFENDGTLGPVTAVYDSAVLSLADANALAEQSGYTVADPTDNPGQYYYDGTVLVIGSYVGGVSQVKGVLVFGDELFGQIGDDLTMVWAF